MKLKNIFILPLVALTLLATPAKADSCRPRYVSCAPTYVRTCVVDTRTECRWATDHCGRRYAYEVTVITYADVYSDGSQRRYTRVG